MTIQVLIDNSPNPSRSLCYEHGLSFYFEVDGLKWLYDLGATAGYYENAKSMGICIEDVDFVILSHAHSDHTGGLEHFLKVNSKAVVVFSNFAYGMSYFSNRSGISRDIGIDNKLVEREIRRFLLVSSDMLLSPNVRLISDIPQKYATPKANRNLTVLSHGTERADTFIHEQVLLISTPKGNVVFSGCSHRGLLNILEACSRYADPLSIAACVGGTHLLDSYFDSCYESVEELELLSEMFVRTYPRAMLYTGHCTGQEAKKILSSKLGENFSLFYSGKTIVI